jgi:hypothetical protein
MPFLVRDEQAKRTTLSTSTSQINRQCITTVLGLKPLNPLPRILIQAKGSEAGEGGQTKAKVQRELMHEGLETSHTAR